MLSLAFSAWISLDFVLQSACKPYLEFLVSLFYLAADKGERLRDKR